MKNIDWDYIIKTCLDTFKVDMQNTEQPKEWHAEGDVYTHTLMVLKELEKSFDSSLNDVQKNILRVAALLHDIGKIKTTIIDGNNITCPNHSRVGARMARKLLWSVYGLCGDKELIDIRESIVTLIRYHGFPPYAIVDKDSTRKMLRIASGMNLLRNFNFDMLVRLSYADMKGRICNNPEESIEKIEYCRELAIEEDILYKAPVFPNTYSGYKFLNGDSDFKGNELYDSTECEVIMTVGLPGTGKDWWISNNCKGMPVISLDKIREYLGIKPEDNQGRVIQKAKEQARTLLRTKTGFVWNATNLTPQRKQLCDLFESYGARVRLVYLETTMENQFKRNHNRDAIVPGDVINKMLSRLVVPEFFEAQTVEWYAI